MRILSRAALRIDRVRDSKEAGLLCEAAARLGFQTVMSPTDEGLAIELSRLDDFPPVNDIAALAFFDALAAGKSVDDALQEAATWLAANDMKDVN